MAFSIISVSSSQFHKLWISLNKLDMRGQNIFPARSDTPQKCSVNHSKNMIILLRFGTAKLNLSASVGRKFPDMQDGIEVQLSHRTPSICYVLAETMVSEESGLLTTKTTRTAP